MVCTGWTCISKGAKKMSNEKAKEKALKGADQVRVDAVSQLAEAEAHFSAAAKLRPDSVLFQNNLGVALLNGKKPTDAAKAFRKVLQVSVFDDQTLASDHRAERCQAIDGPRRGHRRDHTLLHHPSKGAGWPRCRRVLADDHDLDADRKNAQTALNRNYTRVSVCSKTQITTL